MATTDKKALLHLIQRATDAAIERRFPDRNTGETLSWRESQEIADEAPGPLVDLAQVRDRDVVFEAERRCLAGEITRREFFASIKWYNDLWLKGGEEDRSSHLTDDQREERTLECLARGRNFRLPRIPMITLSR